MKKQTPEPMMPGAGDRGNKKPKDPNPHQSPMEHRIDYGKLKDKMNLPQNPKPKPKAEPETNPHQSPKMVPGMSYNKLKKMESEKK